MQAESAVLMAQKLREHVFPDLRVGLVHGRMKSKDKDAVMVLFSAGMLDILVATTVIEVGVNVPNACVMIVENAERFGLSQLHQLRGRVGRGAEQSHCILFRGGGGKTASERLSAIAATQDGFVLAEQDLKLRGPGEAFGTRQHGLPECRIANLYADIDLMQAARDEAILLAGPVSQLQDSESRELRNYLMHRFASRIRDIAMN
jgi:ATP-dependent DNA helicase RecG